MRVDKYSLTPYPKPMQRLIKRGLDIAVALGLGLLLAPVLIALSFMVKR